MPADDERPAHMSHLVIMAAGTGGHIMPGLAVAHEMRRRGWSVSWLGTAHGMENKLVPPAGIALDVIQFTGLRGKGLVHALTGGMRMLAAFWTCLKILRKRGANAVLGMGGYVCFPGGMMAALLGKPLVLVNADAALLMSNRLLSPVADRICFGLDAPGSTKSSKQVVTGNPVREMIAMLPEPAQRFANRYGPLRVLVVGGSLGARVLNENLPRAVALLEPEKRPEVVHQTGQTELVQVQKKYADLGLHAQVIPFIEDMAQAIAHADLVVCRAGAITVSELCAAGAASILVPLVVSTTAHQQDNARWLASEGGAIHLPQSELTAEKLSELITSLDRTRLLRYANAARALAVPNAAARVADEIESVLR
jgi:UDP-N-acetylglucosamine--N-acetylmuramyl-(pentapeptide) pyrophosphoryl-undecaprenol N-acetylglucosamine transferase